jgi:hypothetical protein
MEALRTRHNLRLAVVARGEARTVYETARAFVTLVEQFMRMYLIWLDRLGFDVPRRRLALRLGCGTGVRS